MRSRFKWIFHRLCCLWFIVGAAVSSSRAQDATWPPGREVAVPTRLQDGDEFTMAIQGLLQYGEKLFSAKFTIQAGAGLPSSGVANGQGQQNQNVSEIDTRVQSTFSCPVADDLRSGTRTTVLSDNFDERKRF
jgi:hypothetical protein